MSASLLLAMLLLGAASGLHCVGIVGAFSLTRVIHPRRVLVARQLAFNIGRLATCAAAGLRSFLCL